MFFKDHQSYRAQPLSIIATYTHNRKVLYSSSFHILNCANQHNTKLSSPLYSVHQLEFSRISLYNHLQIHSFDK